MAKGYWLAQVDVHDPEGYKAYAALGPAAVGAYGGRLIVRGGQFERAEGTCRSRLVVVEFPSYQAALDCYHSPDYQSAKAVRLLHASSDLTIVEGAP